MIEGPALRVPKIPREKLPLLVCFLISLNFYSITDRGCVALLIHRCMNVDPPKSEVLLCALQATLTMLMVKPSSTEPSSV
jgi:hypothetical protein